MKKLLIILVLIFESYQTCLAQDRPQVEIQTNKGTIIVELFNETPQHRDNFFKTGKRWSIRQFAFPPSHTGLYDTGR